MKRSSHITLEISIIFFLALTGQTLLLIPHRQAPLLSEMPIFLAPVLGVAAWVVSRWLVISIVTNAQDAKRLVPYAAAITLGVFAFRFAQAGMLIESSLLAALIIGLLTVHIHKKEKPARLKSGLIIALGNIALGATLMFAQRLFLTPVYLPLLNWQTELGIAFFLSGLYALPILLRNKPNASSFPRYLLAVPWAGYSLLFLFSDQLANSIAAFSLVFNLTVADYISRQPLFLSPGNKIGRRLLQTFHIVETALLFFLAGLLSLTGPVTQGFGGREAACVFFMTMSGIASIGILIIYNAILNGFPVSHADKNESPNLTPGYFFQRLSKHKFNISDRLQILEQKNRELEQQRALEKKRAYHLTLLNELSRQLEAQLDRPVAAQLTVNMLEQALNCALAIVFQPTTGYREFKVLAAAGTHIKTLPPSYRQSIQSGVLGRTARQRKTQIVHDTRLDADYVCLGKQRFLSEVSIPLIHQGHLKGILVVNGEKPSAFSSLDIEMIEAAARELMRACERSDYRRRLTDLIQAGISLSTLLDPQAAIMKVATVSRKALQARFTFVALLDQDRKLSRTAQAGSAPKLLECLSSNLAENTFLQAVLNAPQPFRIRDVRKHKQTRQLLLDNPNLRSLLVIPIRLHRRNIGTILAFGKRDEVFFSENDESLAGLLASQAAAAIESAWLYQELRNTLRVTTLLFHLSSGVIQAKGIDQAAKIVVDAAFQLAEATQAGIVLFLAEKKIGAQLVVDASGTRNSTQPPKDLIEQACRSGKSILISSDQISARICYPLQTPLRNYGALWLEIPEVRRFTSRHSSNLQTLANQAAVALERAILLVESHQQAQALENAYQEMEKTYDQTLVALTAALDARDRETKGHSLRVAQIASRLGKELGLSDSQIKALERGALLHDIGKIGISDTILHKPAPLTEAEWEVMRAHPEIGARIVEGIPFLEESLPVIRYHQERWNGSGYPIGLQKNDIPLLARIFAVVDVFDALTTRRPYRKKISTEKALAYLKNQSGILFDPQIVTTLATLIEEKKIENLLADI